MTDEEVDELLKAVDKSSGEINYMGKQASSHANLRKVVSGLLMILLTIYRTRPYYSGKLIGPLMLVHRRTF